MTVKVAINGFGRIGRNIMRALYESPKHDLAVVAVNDLADTETNAHLLQYDTVHGKFAGTVEAVDNGFTVDGNLVRTFSQRVPASLPWSELDIDLVLECTGFFASKDKASGHLEAGASKVLLSAPGKGVDATIVYGVNHDVLDASHTVVSNASCTTNCLAPIAKVLNDAFGIRSGLMTTVHAFTNDQVLTDVFHTDLRRARSATQSMIPTSTGAAAAIGLVLPELDGKLDGFAVRVPTVNVSLVDLTVETESDVSVEAIHESVRSAAQGPLEGILAFNDKPLVSVDFNHSSVSSVFEASTTRVVGDRAAKVCCWYDNEWAFSNRMLDTAAAFMNVS
ncbi:MAG: type I glyceraldehyde-3-phosphate dehydrogenase [Acidiferrobacterales bacterium]|nr:type I glyceraldehyde-3-phosphate dehydrogenase [Acidiferrobacterales bacterium]